jgi:hypothetical protein
MLLRKQNAFFQLVFFEIFKKFEIAAIYGEGQVAWQRVSLGNRENYLPRSSDRGNKARLNDRL